MTIGGRLTIAALSLLALGGCTIATPFKGPGFDPKEGVTLEGSDRVVVAITRAVLQGDRSERSDFWTNVWRVEASLEARQGFIGYSLRRELFGAEAWTMTAWIDESSLDAFVSSSVHQTAIEQSLPALGQTGFARFEVERDDIPLSWDRAVEILEEDGRHYD
ncbi:MAG TPA: hypothetical protein EYH07_16550 [Kiloniellaceae bacterium]|nr:hypothetical protein [Kiloniellaceae bacterium]